LRQGFRKKPCSFNNHAQGFRTRTDKGVSCFPRRVRLRGAKMIYLDCSVTSLQKPREVSVAVSRAIGAMASPGRGSHRPEMLATDCVFDCRMLLASFFNVADPENVIFTFNATHGLNIAINSLVSVGDKVVISGYEHNSVTRSLKALNAEVCVSKSGFSIIRRRLRQSERLFMAQNVRFAITYQTPLDLFCQFGKYRSFAANTAFRLL